MPKLHYDHNYQYQKEYARSMINTGYGITAASPDYTHPLRLDGTGAIVVG